jgi:hypothetical protein
MARLASQQPSSPRPASPLGEKATADQTGLLDGKLKALARQLVEPGSVYSRGEDDPRWRAAVELGESSNPRGIPLLLDALRKGVFYQPVVSALKQLGFKPNTPELEALFLYAEHGATAGERAIPGIELILRRGCERWLRSQALRHLEQIGGERAADAICRALEDPQTYTLFRITDAERAYKRLGRAPPVTLDIKRFTFRPGESSEAEIIQILKRLCEEYDAEERIGNIRFLEVQGKGIGEYLNNHGGLYEMRRVFGVVKRGTRYTRGLEFLWSGIGVWQA